MREVAVFKGGDLARACQRGKNVILSGKTSSNIYTARRHHGDRDKASLSFHAIVVISLLECNAHREKSELREPRARSLTHARFIYYFIIIIYIYFSSIANGA